MARLTRFALALALVLCVLASVSVSVSGRAAPCTTFRSRVKGGCIAYYENKSRCCGHAEPRIGDCPSSEDLCCPQDWLDIPGALRPSLQPPCPWNPAAGHDGNSLSSESNTQQQAEIASINATTDSTEKPDMVLVCEYGAGTKGAGFIQVNGKSLEEAEQLAQAHMAEASAAAAAESGDMAGPPSFLQSALASIANKLRGKLKSMCRYVTKQQLAKMQQNAQQP